MTALPALDRQSRLEMHTLVTRAEDDQVIVGRAATSEFVALPQIGGQALALLSDGRSLGEAERALEAQLGDAVDLVEFARSLIELGFVRAVDGHPVDSGEVLESSLPWLREEHCRWLFTRPVVVALAVVFSAALATVLLHPRLVPASEDFIWTSSTSVVIAVNTAMFLGALAIHELAHLAAARSLGVPGRFSLGTRLHTLVAQTDVTGLWAVPRRRRFRAYVAGMAWDLLLLSCVLMTLAYIPLVGTPQALLSALALLLVFGLVGQLQLFMRTDVYFVLADLLRAKNLTEDAGAYVWSLLRAGLRAMRRQGRPRRDVLASLPPRERRAVRLYAPIMIVGSTVAVGIYALYAVPILIDLLATATDSVWAGATRGQPVKLVDGLLTLAIEGGLQLLFFWVLIRNRGTRVRAVWRRVAAAG